MAWQLPEGVRSSKVETDEAVVHYLESGQGGDACVGALSSNAAFKLYVASCDGKAW